MSCKGQTLTLKQRNNISKGLLGHVIPDSVRKKISLSLMGHEISQVTKNKIRKTVLTNGWPKEARIKSLEFNKNFVPTLEMRKKMSIPNLGSLNIHWKGGISSEMRRIRNSLRYKSWRRKVFQRDQYTCRDCHKSGGWLEAHHIKSFADFPALRFKVENGRTLCGDCHNESHSLKMLNRVDGIVIPLVSSGSYVA